MSVQSWFGQKMFDIVSGSWVLFHIFRRNLQANGVFVRGPKENPEGKRTLEHIEEVAGGRTESYRNLICAIENDTPVYADELNGLRTIEILDAVLRSRESGHREPVHIHR